MRYELAPLSLPLKAELKLPAQIRCGEGSGVFTPNPSFLLRRIFFTLRSKTLSRKDISQPVSRVL